MGVQEASASERVLGSREVLIRRRNTDMRGLGNCYTPGRHHKGKRSRYPDLLKILKSNTRLAVSPFLLKKKKIKL